MHAGIVVKVNIFDYKSLCVHSSHRDSCSYGSSHRASTLQLSDTLRNHGNACCHRSLEQGQGRNCAQGRSLACSCAVDDAAIVLECVQALTPEDRSCPFAALRVAGDTTRRDLHLHIKFRSVAHTCAIKFTDIAGYGHTPLVCRLEAAVKASSSAQPKRQSTFGTMVWKVMNPRCGFSNLGVMRAP